VVFVVADWDEYSASFFWTPHFEQDQSFCNVVLTASRLIQRVVSVHESCCLRSQANHWIEVMNQRIGAKESFKVKRDGINVVERYKFPIVESKRASGFDFEPELFCHAENQVLRVEFRCLLWVALM